MGKFSSADKQAASVIKALQSSGAIRSLGTARGYGSALTQVASWAKSTRIKGGLRGMTVQQARDYLELRSEEIGQKALDMERQALQAMLRNTTGRLCPDERLPVVKSDHAQILKSRSYTAAQVAMVAAAQREKNSLSTQIAHAAGLRGHELLTLRRLDERNPSNRPALDTKFHGRAGPLYTVHGKGGLVRVVMIPADLAKQLEDLRYDSPQRVTDRGIHYAQHYAINGGQLWANSFSQAAQRTLGWSAGAHGLRHSYAQERMHELQKIGLGREQALETVSQEMGHFRPAITEVYLR